MMVLTKDFKDSIQARTQAPLAATDRWQSRRYQDRRRRESAKFACLLGPDTESISPNTARPGCCCFAVVTNPVSRKTLR